ncbi:hypothetical protein ABZ468_43420 [Streptomyces sp. NPDC005708]
MPGDKNFIVQRGDLVRIDEASEPGADDCATCVDLWHGRSWVRA